MGIEPSTIAAGDLEEEEFGGKGVGRDMGFAEKMNTLLQERANVHLVGLCHRHKRLT
jgi:hypothetical protein